LHDRPHATDLGIHPARTSRSTELRGTQDYRGGPKASYITPWDETPDWERVSATAVYEQVRAFVDATDGHTAKLTRAQKGRFVALCWIGQIYKHIAEPKAAYVADWDDPPHWQQETDADIFEHIEGQT